MSLKPPPQEMLESMGRGRVNELSSIACFAAATAVQRNEPVTGLDTWGGQPLTAEEREFLMGVIEKARQMFLHATPDELAHAIALYRAHLKYCGYSVEEGMSH
jgi:hypothetical protein